MPTYDLGLEHVSLAFATKNIFTDVTQGVFEGDRIGIVGKNGDGKSTLLHLFKGTQEPDSGRVTMRNGLTFGMLDQRDPLDDNATVREAALEGREDYEWAAETKSREIVEALLGGISLDAKIGSLSGGQRRRADLARLLLKDWDILALDEPTNHLDVVTIHWLAEHLKNRWPSGQGALLLVTHDRWFLDEVCESMWEVHDGVIDPFEGGYSAYMLQRVERDRQADVRETKRRNLARKELAWLTRGARARSTKQKFHVKAARELIADVPPVRNTLELKQMATSRLGKQVVDLIDVTQIFEHAQGEADIDPDVAEMEASASRVDVVPAMYAEPQAHGSVEVAVDDLTVGIDDGHLVGGDVFQVGAHLRGVVAQRNKVVIVGNAQFGKDILHLVLVDQTVDKPFFKRLAGKRHLQSVGHFVQRLQFDAARLGDAFGDDAPHRADKLLHLFAVGVGHLVIDIRFDGALVFAGRGAEHFGLEVEFVQQPLV